MKANKALAIAAILAPSTFFLTDAVAYGVGDTTDTAGAVFELDGLLSEVLSWIQGPLGTLIAIAALTVGLAVGIMQQTVMAAVVGIGFAAVIAYGPDVLQGIAGSSAEVLV
jgi:hypothetical protein